MNTLFEAITIRFNDFQFFIITPLEKGFNFVLEQNCFCIKFDLSFEQIIKCNEWFIDKSKNPLKFELKPNYFITISLGSSTGLIDIQIEYLNSGSMTFTYHVEFFIFRAWIELLFNYSN